MTKSIRELAAEGWELVAGVSCDGYPACDHVLMTRRGEYIRHVYSVYDDSSDYPYESSVRWDLVEVYEVTIRRCRSVQNATK